MDSNLIDQLVDSLIDTLGLTYYEARAYVALLEESPITRYKLAKLARIPSSKNYGAVQRLYDKGLILQTTDEVPLVSPLSPEMLLERLRAQQKSSFSQLGDLLAEVEREQDRRQMQHIWTIAGTQAAYDKACSIIDRCENTLYIAAFEPDLKVLNTTIKEASLRDVNVKALVYGSSPLKTGQAVEHGDVDGVIGRSGGRWLALVSDDHEVLVSHPMERESVSFWTDSKVLALIISKYVQEHFFSERPISFDR